MQGFTLPPIIRGVVNWLFLASFMLLSVTAQAGNWTATGSLNTTRTGHDSTVLLPDGKVMVVGGIDSYSNNWIGTNTVELYAPNTGTWSYTTPMSVKRQEAIAILLPNGKILAAGGAIQDYSNLCSAEIYNPATATWTATGAMQGARVATNSVVLTNGKVLVVGGANWGMVSGCKGAYGHLATAELYDPTTGTWASTGSMHAGRDGHTTTILPNGKVLVTGGYDGNTLATAELYDQATGNWTYTTSMHEVRHRHVAMLLTNGKVLIAGGGTWNGGTYGKATAELYDSANSTWTMTGTMSVPRVDAKSTLLSNGKVLVTGGTRDHDFINPIATTEIYDPATGMWSAAGSMSEARSYHSAVLLNNGKVLVAGGVVQNSSVVVLRSAELYTPGPDLIATTTTLTSSLNPSGLNQNVTFTAKVTATTVPTGMVTFKVDGVTKAAKSLNNGQTTYATNTLTIGNRTIRAEYAGNTTWSPSNAELTQVVNSGKDFIITSLAPNPFVTPLGQAPTVRVVIKNQGVTAGAGGTLSLWLDRTTGATCNTASDKNVAIGTLAAGASKTINVSGFTPPTVGSLKMLRAFVDSTCATVETNETNNQAVRNYWVGIPDLTVTSITVNSNFPVFATTFTAKIVVKNQGTAALSSTSFVDLWLNQAIRQNCDAEGDRWEEIGTLAAGASQTITFRYLPSGTIGVKMMRAYVDSWCEREDANRSNNQLTKIYSVYTVQ